MRTGPLAGVLLKNFPDLGYLKTCIAERQAWPTVLLQVEAKDAYRPDVLGPLSLFANVRGASVVRSEDMATRIPPGTYALTNAGARYTLEIEEAAETQNLHVSGDAAAAVYRALVTDDDRLIEVPDAAGPPLTVFPRLYRRTPTFDLLLGRAFEVASATPAALDEAVADVLVHLLAVHRGALYEAARVPAARAATRTELYRRLARSVDLMHATTHDALPLDVLAEAACLSKYHYLRAFRQTFGTTPHRYHTRLRIAQAQRLLTGSRLAVAEVGFAIGFDEPSAFTRAFRRHVGVPPATYRAAA
ncbi:MAG: AraC family transcriptional regulator [Bacteroidota bacterium]